MSGPYVVFAKADTESVRRYADEVLWRPHATAYDDELTWNVDEQSHVTWHALDGGFGSLLVTSPSWDAIVSELSITFPILGDVEIMTAVGNAGDPAELSLWGSRLCEFARGSEFYEPTLHVINSLLASDHYDFAAAAARALSRARWPQLVPSLERTAQRWPELDADCRRALASIQSR
jgi:hypothetical protein